MEWEIAMKSLINGFPVVTERTIRREPADTGKRFF